MSEIKRSRRIKSIKGIGDYLIIIATIALLIIGCVFVYSATYYDEILKDNGIFTPLIKIVFWAALGCIAFAAASFIPYRIYAKFAFIFLLISLLLLVLVLYSPLGITYNGARRWLDIGVSTIAPSELLKISGIIFIANFYKGRYMNKHALKDFKENQLPILILIIISFGLIYLQPNLSTAMIVSLIFLGMIFISGGRIFVICTLGIAGIFGVAALVISTGGYHLNRFITFLDPFQDPKGEGYQVVKSLQAITSGGFFGKGLGNGIISSHYLPESQNDFIFTVICEEAGIIFGIGVICIYIFLISRIYLVAIRSNDRFSCLIASGIGIMLSIQVIFHFFVTISLAPNTGVSLPLISQGGTSLMINMFAIGIVYNISRNIEEGLIEKGVLYNA